MNYKYAFVIVYKKLSLFSFDFMMVLTYKFKFLWAHTYHNKRFLKEYPDTNTLKDEGEHKLH